MIVDEVTSGEFVVRLNRDELIFLNNAMNEVCNGMEVWEFSTRLGAKREDALRMIDNIGEALA